MPVANTMPITHGFNPRRIALTYLFFNAVLSKAVTNRIIKNEGRSGIRRIKSAEKLRKVYNDMLKNGAPFDLCDLNIKGDEIIKAVPKINIENLDELLDKLLFKTALNPKINNKQDLLLLANKLINSKRDYYLEQ